MDDEDGVRESLRAVLELSEFDVKTAANVSEAIHLIDTEAFDVLLSDGTKQTSGGAVEHGKVRHEQGYTIPMIIEESRMLQVSYS